MHAVLAVSGYVVPLLLGKQICMSLEQGLVGSILIMGDFFLLNFHSLCLQLLLICYFLFGYIVKRAARNPYNKSKITGGSSSGSAAVVAAGLCPVALGVDGGGTALSQLKTDSRQMHQFSYLIVPFQEFSPIVSCCFA